MSRLLTARLIAILTLILTLPACAAPLEPAFEVNDTAAEPTALASPTSMANHLPGVAEIMTHGEEVPFVICAEAPAWTRPSEEEQAAQWDSGRYTGMPEDLRTYHWTHDFFIVYGSASIEYDIVNLAGLWTLPTAGCLAQERQDAVVKFEAAEVWVLLHTVREVKRIDTSYAIVVEPVDQGVQFIQFSRPASPDPQSSPPLTVYFIAQDGHVVDSIAESDYIYWPIR